MKFFGKYLKKRFAKAEHKDVAVVNAFNFDKSYTSGNLISDNKNNCTIFKLDLKPSRITAK